MFAFLLVFFSFSICLSVHVCIYLLFDACIFLLFNSFIGVLCHVCIPVRCHLHMCHGFAMYSFVL